MANESVILHVQSTDLRKLFLELKAMEGSLQVELRRGMREAALPAVQSVKRASAWSSRIPASVKAQPFFTAKRAGVRIIVDARTAPEGRPLEHGGNPGDFRHPVFGHKDRWVPQPSRPFFYASVERSVEVEIAMRAVMARVAAKGGM